MSDGGTSHGPPAADEPGVFTSSPSAPTPLPEGEQAAYAWIPEPKRLGKVLMTSKQRRAMAEGLRPGVLVFGWGITVTAWDDAYSVRWEEITGLFKNFTRRTERVGRAATYQVEYQYKLELASGQTKSFGGMIGELLDRSSRAAQVVYAPGVTTPVTVEQLGRVLDREVSRVQLPLAISRFNAGEPVAFGPLTVTKNTIAVGDASAPWSEIAGVQTKRGIVYVRKASKRWPWKTVPVREIPNFPVFTALVDAAVAQRPSAPGP